MQQQGMHAGGCMQQQGMPRYALRCTAVHATGPLSAHAAPPPVLLLVADTRGCVVWVCGVCWLPDTLADELTMPVLTVPVQHPVSEQVGGRVGHMMQQLRTLRLPMHSTPLCSQAGSRAAASFAAGPLASGCMHHCSAAYSDHGTGQPCSGIMTRICHCDPMLPASSVSQCFHS
jgi:hypothetical protein